MLEDLREQASTTTDIEDKEPPRVEERTRSRSRRFLGITPTQRFFIALMLLIIVCLLSTFCLLVTEKIVLPFL